MAFNCALIYPNKVNNPAQCSLLVCRFMCFADSGYIKVRNCFPFQLSEFIPAKSSVTWPHTYTIPIIHLSNDEASLLNSINLQYKGQIVFSCPGVQYDRSTGCKKKKVRQIKADNAFLI